MRQVFRVLRQSNSRTTQLQKASLVPPDAEKSPLPAPRRRATGSETRASAPQLSDIFGHNSKTPNPRARSGDGRERTGPSGGRNNPTEHVLGGPGSGRGLLPGLRGGFYKHKPVFGQKGLLDFAESRARARVTHQKSEHTSIGEVLVSSTLWKTFRGRGAVAKELESLK